MPAALLRVVSDERLVEQLRAGSEQAFEALFARYNGRLLAFCRNMLRSHEEAEDVVQQTFLAAYCDLVRSDKPIAPRPWLFTIARNRCVSILRAQRGQAVDAVPLVADNLFAEVDRREDLRRLLADLGRLPDDQRVALLLTELSGVPQDEIASILGCRPERVKALVFQARSSLAADRTARDTPCYEIRSQLATLHGGALRRAVLRRHVRSCAGCREFHAKVRLQRRQLGALLPTGPGLGLGLPGVLSGSGVAGIGGLTLNAGALGGGLVARVLVGAALSSGGAVAGVTAIAHSGATPTVSPAAPAANGEAGERRASIAREPVRDSALAEDSVVTFRAGGAVPGERAGGLEPGLRMPRPAVAGSVPETAALLELAHDSLQPSAATGETASDADEPATQEPAKPEEKAQELDQQPPSGPPAPSSQAGPGGHAAGPPPSTGGSPHPNGPAGNGPPAAAGGSPHPNGPAGNGPPPSTGGAGPPPGPVQARAAHGKPDTGGPASPAVSGANPGSPPGGGGMPGGTHAPGYGR